MLKNAPSEDLAPPLAILFVQKPVWSRADHGSNPARSSQRQAGPYQDNCSPCYHSCCHEQPFDTSHGSTYAHRTGMLVASVEVDNNNFAVCQAQSVSHITAWHRKDQIMTDVAAGGADILRILLSILLPPVGVFLQVGLGVHFWLNVVLTILGYIPGIIHALFVILKK